LVFQGLTLPWLIRKVEPGDKSTTIPEREQELIIQKKIARASLQFLEEEYGKDRVQNEHLDNLFARLQIDLRSLDQELEESNDTKENSSKSYQSIYLELLEQQRLFLTEMNRLAEFDEELIRKYLSLIDLEEFKIREKQLQEADSE
jgi:CPA1 family monovalent cation:H+ antiporter